MLQKIKESLFSRSICICMSQIMAFICFNLLAGSLFASKDTHCETMPAAYHEFVMFGNKHIYLSHFSMFHAIHGYQVIIEASLEKSGQPVENIFLQDKLGHPSRVYTLSPAVAGSSITRRRADWILPDYMKKNVTFNADIHWGTQPNQFLMRDVTVKIINVIYFRKFEEADKTNPKLTYILFGDPTDHYLAHRVAAYPDFDQILVVNSMNRNIDDTQTFVIDTPDNLTSRLKKNSHVQGVIFPSNFPLELKTGHEIYFENLTEQP